MMKPMSDDSIDNHNWLGFSLSPHLEMEVPSHHPNHNQFHHHHQLQTHVSTSAGLPQSVHPSMFLSPQMLQNSRMCFVGGENGGFHSPLTVMPLKSDGSLCIIEALTRSHPQAMVQGSVPKLENFLDSASMGSEAMALRLDSIYYQQNAEQETYKEDHLGLQLQDQAFFSEEGCQGMMYIESFDGDQGKETTQIAECNAQMNWVNSNCYSSHQQVEQPQVENVLADIGVASTGYVAVTGCRGDIKSLSLSMSPGSQSSTAAADPSQITAPVSGSLAIESRKRVHVKACHKQTVHRKSIDTFGQRTSQYRGVTKHRWTGRYEAHLWDNSCKKEGQTRKGRQVYLGGYDMEEKAARAYDLAALKYWGTSSHINFQLENYKDELEEMKNMTRQEYVAHLRRRSSGFSRGASMYRGVTRHHQHGRWQARIGRVAGNKDLYLGTFSESFLLCFSSSPLNSFIFLPFSGPLFVFFGSYELSSLQWNHLFAWKRSKSNCRSMEGPTQEIQRSFEEVVSHFYVIFCPLLFTRLNFYHFEPLHNSLVYALIVQFFLKAVFPHIAYNS